MNALPAQLSLLLHHPEVRDLAWACFTSPLLDASALDCPEQIGNCQLALTPARWDWVLSVDREPKELIKHLSKRHSPRLGLYFESLWQFFLQQDKEVDLITHNLPVRDGGRTIGEFDCLYYCHLRQRPVHLEIAVKFYLHYLDSRNPDVQIPEQPNLDQQIPAQPASPQPALSHWLGPNNRDRLDLKLQRMLDHQILLSRDPRGAEALAGIGVESPLLELEVKGRLFHHFSTHAQPPPGYNLATPLHHWSRQGEVSHMVSGREDAFLRLHRQQWLATVDTAGADIVDPTELCDDLQKEPLTRATKIAILDSSGREQKRVFIVPDTWPEQ